MILYRMAINTGVAESEPRSAGKRHRAYFALNALDVVHIQYDFLRCPVAVGACIYVAFDQSLASCLSLALIRLERTRHHMVSRRSSKTVSRPK
jgi:hypothetical protein